MAAVLDAENRVERRTGMDTRDDWEDEQGYNLRMAQIRMPDGTKITGMMDDYAIMSGGYMIQVVIEGRLYMTAGENVVMWSE